MRVTIKYFASLREAIGVEQETVDLPASVQTAADLRSWLINRGDPFAAALAAGRSVRVAVNLEMACPDTALCEGAELAFFPPVTGG